MNVFYDAKRKKTNEWVFVMFIIIPIIVAILFFVFGRKMVEKNVDLELDESRIKSSRNY